ncbi:lycopene cyclase domain-containing protein [Glaciihabitans sp. UYNi722]|uniref:lycopene cyclase domain-containing protein n=1 Tax=Glaciihabitans sp. UYNi722 TaxID=3156344 RepID=UPI00339A5B16
MSYWALNAIFLAVVAVAGIAALLKAQRGGGMRWTSVVFPLLILLVFTSVFDNVMIGIGLVGYDTAKISGAFVGVAPLEDFAYAVAAALLLPSLWVLTARRKARS